jgi:TonB family protein
MKALLLLLVVAMGSSEAIELPQPIQKEPVRWPTDLPRHTGSRSIQVEFVVLPSGATSDVRLKQSSGQRPCDRAALYAVKRWRYAPRKEPITVVEMVDTCTY